MRKSNIIDSSKIDKLLNKELDHLTNPIILEFGVQLGSSTKFLLDICEKKNGRLYSVDIDDYSNLFKESKKWKFIQSRDDDFKKIYKLIPHEIDLIYLDTHHTSQHVEKIIYNYFDILKKKGLFIADDISWIPYLKNNNFNNFFCEINNKETFDTILEIYNGNVENIEINFSFYGSGWAIIRKKSLKKLNNKKK